MSSQLNKIRAPVTHAGLLPVTSAGLFPVTPAGVNTSHVCGTTIYISGEGSEGSHLPEHLWHGRLMSTARDCWAAATRRGEREVARSVDPLLEHSRGKILALPEKGHRLYRELETDPSPWDQDALMRRATDICQK